MGPDGHRLPGWPVTIKLPGPDFARDGVDSQSLIHDPKLMYSVAVGNVASKTGPPQVFVSSFDCSGKGVDTTNTVTGLAAGGGATAAKAWLYGVWADGTRHKGGAYLPNWPVAVSGLSFCYDQSIDFVGEGASPPLIADVGGSPRVFTSAPTGQPQAFNADGSVYQSMDLSCQSAACGPNPPYRPTGDTHTITLTGQGGLGDLTGDGSPSYVQSSTGIESILTALGQAGQATLPQVYEKAWDPATGKLRSGYPVRQDGFPFFDAPIVADVGAPAKGRDAIEANDTYWIHAWDAGGAEATGFPKYTGQWVGFVGAVGDPRLNGQQHLVFGTREGDLFDWRVPGSAARNTSWWHYRHDERLTGNDATDARRPAAITGATAHRSGTAVTLRFTAPGDDWNLGRAKAYQVRWSTRPLTQASFVRGHRLAVSAAPGDAGTHEALSLRAPATARYLAVRAVDDAGNAGPVWRSVAIR